ATTGQQLSTRPYLQHPHRAPREGLPRGEKNDMANDDLAATSSHPRTTGPPKWPTLRGKLVGCKCGGASGRTADLAQVRSNPQRSYDRSDIGKVEALTRRRMPHRKDGGCGGRVRRHGKPRGQRSYQVRMTYNTHYISSCTSTRQGERKINHQTNLIVGWVTLGTYPTRPLCRSRLPTRTPPLQQPTPATGYEGSIYLAEHRLRPETTTGELAHKGLNQQFPPAETGADRAAGRWKKGRGPPGRRKHGRVFRLPNVLASRHSREQTSFHVRPHSTYFVLLWLGSGCSKTQTSTCSNSYVKSDAAVSPPVCTKDSSRIFVWFQHNVAAG
ncbi:hypothetical protein BHE74_00028220, partial [Ensete ventricosum]